MDRVPPVALTLLPAVDIAGGRAVHVAAGDTDRATQEGKGRAARELALAFQAEGASWIHLVDLDAAFGRGANTELLRAVIGELDIDVELAGGIADDRSLARALATGCARVNLATQALDDPDFCERAVAAHGERIAVSLDVRAVAAGDEPARHRLAPRGAPSRAGTDLAVALERLDRAGCARYVVTDVARDGLLAGPDLDLYRAVAGASPAAVIASGGIGSIEDLVRLAELAATSTNLEGSIMGQALHVGRFTLAEALVATRRVDPAPG